MFKHKKVVRVMPSMAISVGQGVALWRASKALSNSDKRRLSDMLSDFTNHFEVERENLIDSGGVIYGCGKAFFFLLAQAMQHAAEKYGFTSKESRWLVEKTFLGSALMQADIDYQHLMDSIATKKGVTEATLKLFAKKGFKKIVEQAVDAGYKRTKELSHG
jgi:pyrroline-5-carboxylate reductase